MDVDENEDRKMDENIKVKLENEKDTTLGIDGNKKTAIKRGTIIDKGVIWNLREAAASITYGAATTSLVISCSLWSPKALSPPLGSNEVLVSNVIELSHDGPPDLELSGDAKGNITVALLHSASNLKGYEVVIKQLVDPEYNKWKDLETKNIWDASVRPGVPDWLFPFAEAPCTITRHSSFAAIWRLKSFTFSRPTSMASGFTCNVPDFPDISVEIPTNFVPAGQDFCLTLKVQEFPSSEPVEKRIFISPVLHISCTQNVAFPLPVTIKLPVRIPERQELPLDFCMRIHVLHDLSRDTSHEWHDITNVLEEPVAVSANGIVAFKVRHFSRFWAWVTEARLPQVVKDLASKLSFRSMPQYVKLSTCLCESTVPEDFVLKIFCYPSTLQFQVEKILSRYRVPYQGEGKSVEPICKGDKILVTFLSALIPQEEENVFLRFLGDEVDLSTDLIVRVGSDSVPQLKFVRSQDSLFLCRVAILPTSPNREVASAATPQVVTEQKVKVGTPKDEELESLALRIISWKSLGRRLGFDEARLTAFERENHSLSEQAYKMLLSWKERNGRCATFEVLYKALTHELVNRRDLAERYCF
ncbi:p53-induced death domain-containing protein 1-like [Oculina patagonica]